jgi:cytidylate kinase
MTSGRRNGVIVAIDGPSGAGKSTITRLLADKIGYIHLDTGAMFRSVALAVHRAGVSPDDDSLLADVCRSIRIEFDRTGDSYRVLLNGEDVTTEIRRPEISLLTSVISTKAPVRETLLAQQRAMAKDGGVILEGRDIGTVVFPDAEIKFFLSATAEERGKRRYLELLAKGEAVSLDQTVSQVVARDLQDEGREIAPLRMAADAIFIDSTSLSQEQVLDLMISEIENRSRS